MIYKPKGMRWQTFNRLMEKADQLASESDAVFAARAMQLWVLLPPDVR